MVADGLKSPIPWSTQVRRAASLLGRYRWRITGILLMTLFGAVLGALEPLALKYVLDLLSAKGTVGQLTLGLGGFVGLLVLKDVINCVAGWFRGRTQVAVEYDLRAQTIRRLHALPVSFYQAQSVGGLMTKLDRGIGQLVGMLGTLAFDTLPSILYLIVAITLMCQLDWRLTLVTAVFAPLPAVIGVLASREQAERERTLLNRWSDIYARFNEVLGGIRTVKSFSMEGRETRRFLRGLRETNRTVVRGIGIDIRVGAVKSAVSLLARTTVLGVGGYLVLQGQMTVGTIVAFLGYIGGLFGPVEGLTGVYQTLRRASAALDVIHTIHSAPEDPADVPGAEQVNTTRGHLTFENVSFAYSGTRGVLRDLNLEIPAGQTLAIVGPSGSGKTTITALAQRLYDPTKGRVLLDGKDLRTLRQQSLRRQIGVVLQDGLIFRDSVRRNIAYGRPWATQEEIEAAARAANAHDFIVAMPEGYDTDLGERGGTLSAGQRQRIAIARALLTDPPILILDEATSALDAESEAKVQQALDRLMKNRTTIVIAHRLATVTRADRIVVLSEGRIIESGTHRELMEQGGVYAGLVAHQTDGLLDLVNA